MCIRDSFHGARIETDTPVLFGLAPANRDPRIFDRPHEFDPNRSNNAQHLSFGHGVHFCIGSHLARRELETGIRILFERFPDMELTSDAQIAFEGCVLRGPTEIRVRLNP